METILNKLNSSLMKGALLEEVVEDILSDYRFANIRRQKSGAQYGYDLVATKQGKWDETWKFECKNLSEAITINDIAPKLIWHLSGECVDRFIIVSVTGPNSYLEQLFEKIKFPFPIEIWSGEYLVRQIINSPRALRRLGITEEEVEKPAGGAAAIIYEQSLISFDTMCSEKLPYSFDYFHSEKGLTKAYTEEWINLLAGFCNNSKRHTFICTEINVMTLHYSNVNSRIFRQSKLKGVVKPAKYNFVPSTIPSRALPILPPDHIIEVKANKDEFILLELSTEKLAPGYYELMFEAKGRLDKKDLTLYSPIFPLHVAEKNADCMRLYTVGKFYDSPANEVLNLKQETWNAIKNIGEDTMAYLGPTMNDVTRGGKDFTWKIRTIKGTPGRDPSGHFILDIDMNAPAQVYYDIGTPVKERIFSQEDAFANALGPDWKEILAKQFNFPIE